VTVKRLKVTEKENLVPKPSKVLIIGSGLIIIGQAVEFDYEREPQ